MAAIGVSPDTTIKITSSLQRITQNYMDRHKRDYEELRGQVRRKKLVMDSHINLRLKPRSRVSTNIKKLVSSMVFCRANLVDRLIK